MDTTNFFEHYYSHASVNSLLIMDVAGNILDVNKSFTKNFGFTTEDLKGKHFSELFTSSDKEKKVPEKELETVIKDNHADDEGFLLNKDGRPVWVSGESISVIDKEGNKFIVKDVINLEQRKHLSLFLNDSEDLLDRIFHFTKDIPMLIIDAAMQVIDINKAFISFFNIEKFPAKNCKLRNVGNPFWNESQVRMFVSNLIVTSVPMRRKKFNYMHDNGTKKIILLDSKIFIHPDMSRRIFLIIDEVQNFD